MAKQTDSRGPKSVSADELNQLGISFAQQGKLDEAIANFDRALQLKPDLAQAHYNLAITLQQRGRLDEAVASYRRALLLKPDYVSALVCLGEALKEQNKLDEAIASWRQALRFKPDQFDALNFLGNAYSEQGNFEAAGASYRRSLQYQPKDPIILNNLGAVLQQQGQLGEAIACHRRAVELAPDYAEAHSNLGVALNEAGMLGEAVASCRRAIELKPEYAGAHNNLGNAFKDQGRLDEAVACFRRAVALRPDYVEAHSNLLFTIIFSSSHDAQAIYDEHRRWNLQHAEPLQPLAQPFTNVKAPDRRLRIGYVSPNLRTASVGRFMLPLLQCHDHANFEIFCYSSSKAPDALTAECRRRADGWRDVHGLPDGRLAEMIRTDRIDVLVDLTMHMANNHLLVFARRPAPVQVTYLAYVGTTGLDAIQYRLTDRYLDPPGLNDAFYSEQSVYLPETYWCYQPITAAPVVDTPPSSQTGQVTFGCLNPFCKVTAPTLEAWGLLLEALPESRLLLHASAGGHRERVAEVLARRGASADRLIFAKYLPLEEYFRMYERIDVALDPFPYGGGTTTCDALWMGVPVVSLAGRVAVGRGGVSILSNIDLADLVAHDVGEYVRIAKDLATDQLRLKALRATLRRRMQASPLMDAPRFARGVEAAYREMWRRWCS